MLRAASFAASVLLVATATPSSAAWAQQKTAVLGGLDKITAKVSEFEAPIGRAVRFGTLEIVVRACAKRPPEEPPETTAFLEVTDQRPGGEARKLFAGWMFASSPALSALEHPVYDVWVIDCKTSAPSAPDGKR